MDWDDYQLKGNGKEILSGKKVTSIGRIVEETQISDAMLTILTIAGVAMVGAGWLAKNSRGLPVLRI